MQKKIKKILFFVAYLTINFSSNAQSNDEPSNIYWNDSCKLKWSDFLGEPKPLFEGNTAVSDVSILVSEVIINNKLDIKVECIFNRDYSWVIIKTDNLLLHEQNHFDLEEIYARKLRKMVKDLQKSKDLTSSDITSFYNEIILDCNNRNDLYDKETNFSNNIKKQLEWELKIKKELDELSDYKKQ